MHKTGLTGNIVGSGEDERQERLNDVRVDDGLVVLKLTWVQRAADLLPRRLRLSAENRAEDEQVADEREREEGGRQHEEEKLKCGEAE